MSSSRLLVKAGAGVGLAYCVFNIFWPVVEAVVPGHVQPLNAAENGKRGAMRRAEWESVSGLVTKSRYTFATKVAADKKRPDAIHQALKLFSLSASGQSKARGEGEGQTGNETGVDEKARCGHGVLLKIGRSADLCHCDTSFLQVEHLTISFGSVIRRDHFFRSRQYLPFLTCLSGFRSTSSMPRRDVRTCRNVGFRIPSPLPLRIGLVASQRLARRKGCRHDREDRYRDCPCGQQAPDP